jgi:hypothetical protein
MRREEPDLWLGEGLALQELLDLLVEAAMRVPHPVLPLFFVPPAAGAAKPDTRSTGRGDRERRGGRGGGGGAARGAERRRRKRLNSQEKRYLF